METRTSLVIQWLRIRLPMQEMWVQSLLKELRSTYSLRACELQLLSLSAVESVLSNKQARVHHQRAYGRKGRPNTATPLPLN